MTKAIMIQGAGSNVGKSLIVAGIARAFANRGLITRPFKPQNMSNNAAVTVDGGEIGRAQALQARAARVPPHTDMNPVLLKPESDTGAQVIVQGKRWKTLKARDYGREKAALMAPVLESFRRLAQGADIIVVEGAGSPAEINLREGDIANMGFAEAAAVPVVLVGDIDRGGVIAQIAGTSLVLPEADRNRIKGFIVNKFRGDVTLFAEGMKAIEAHTPWPGLGVLPWFDEAHRLPAEDIMDLKSAAGGNFRIAVPRLKRIANFDDLDPLSAEAGVTVEIIEAGRPLPGDANLVLLPGSKSTIADLAHFRSQGWDIDLVAHLRRGGQVLGICGGYQMLGRRIHDPEGIEGAPGSVDGLGHLDIETTMRPEKHLREIDATWVSGGQKLRGYEIHIGETTGPDCARPLLMAGERPAGARSANGQVMGCYLHGMFASDSFRKTFLQGLGAEASDMHWDHQIDETLDALARHIETHLDLDQLYALAETL